MNNSDMKGIVCTNCGSTDVEISDEKHAKCKHCQTNFLIEDNSSKTSTIIIKNELKNEDGSPIVGFLKVQKKIKIEDFTRKAYLELFNSSLTPVSICDAKFGIAHTETRNYTLVNADYDFNYNVNLGFDRTEEYLGEETYYDHGQKKTRIVMKTRTVTDWRPANGSFSGSRQTAYICNSESMPDELNSDYKGDPVEVRSKNFENYVINYGAQDSLEEIKEGENSINAYAPTQRDIKEALNLGAEKVSNRCYNSLKADHKKDFNYSYKSKEKMIVGITSEEYVLPFTSVNPKTGNEANYEITSFSHKVDAILDFTPGFLAESEVRNKNEKRRSRTLFIPTLAFFALWLVLFTVIVGVATKFFVVGLITGIISGLFTTLVFYLIWRSIHRKVWENIEKNQVIILNSNNSAKKMEKLKEIFNKLGLAPLTESEERTFKSSDLPKETGKVMSFLTKIFTYESKKKK